MMDLRRKGQRKKRPLESANKLAILQKTVLHLAQCHQGEKLKTCQAIENSLEIQSETTNGIIFNMYGYIISIFEGPHKLFKIDSEKMQRSLENEEKVLLAFK